MLRSLHALLRLRVDGDRFVEAVHDQHVQPVEKRVTIVGPDPVRILIFGGDYATGYNVRRRQDALDGAIAGLLHARLSRGVSVENRSSPDVPLDALTASIGSSGAHTYDIAIWCPTFREAARRPFARTWRRTLTEVVRFLRTTSDSGILLLTIPELLGSQPLAVIARTRAALLNAAIMQVASKHARVRAVAVPPIRLDDIDELDGTETYAQAAQALLPDLLRLLGAEAPERTLSAADRLSS